MAIKVIVDTDTGVDDAMGCALALRSPELDVVAFTSVFGNVSVELTTENTAYLMEMFGRPEIPLARGAGRALVGSPNYSPFVHGDDGVGNAGFEKAKVVKPVRQSAAELTVELARKHPGEITFIALGPLTNLALALAIDPELPKFLPRVVWMGGAAFVPGNVTAVAEADAWHDPEGAQMVLQQAGWRVDMVGLDVTDDTLLDEADLTRLQAGSPQSRYIAAMMPFYMDFYSAKLGRYACAAHSALTVAIVADPAIVTAQEAYPVQVELSGRLTRGMTVVDRRRNNSNGGQPEWKDTPLTNIPTDVDRLRFREMFLSRIEK
ncbi:MAG TPA: nucleoside hydrolase [Mesorhizobium sp.]|jgi:purine nucleosidase|uniref:nucleoside hydrolase n=1 Tax=Mesorhizobium sp. TaxID=1871066 RepID=UPI002DDCCDE7|nr:nucleoside hydrolase [Mesorhizobium sp.]HEV2501670.1 nucleoside hydrolase [Mesorhizobium sp.]